eukprot:evm.model.scf_710.1 EVM.evm.TU.scf_710.1   scf_710:815-1273(-)
MAGARPNGQFAAKVQRHASQILTYGDELLQAQALSLIPVDRLRSEADAAVAAAGEDQAQPIDPQAALVRALLDWFKGEFFEWVNSPPCWNCGQGEASRVAVEAPSEAEARHDASRTEVYTCLKCGAGIRFPRCGGKRVESLLTKRNRALGED